MEPEKQSLFPRTRWTLVDRAANPDAPASDQSLNDLLERYLPALKAHLTHTRRLPPDHANDMLQGFVADKILRGELLVHANKDRGKFRTFLLTALDRYLFNQIRDNRTQRRSPGNGPPISLDEIADTVGGPPALPAFDLAWIREIIDETLRRVERDCRETHRAHYWQLFAARIVTPLLQGQKPCPYSAYITKLGFRSPMQASNALFTTKRIFERAFREVVQEYAGDEESAEREIGELRAILAEASANP